jgi:hypothetical protein
MTRVQLIEKLLRTYHLNVAERRQLIPPVIHFSEILAVIRNALQRENRFSSGHLTLEKRSGATYRLHYLEYDPQASDLVNEWGGPSVPATIEYTTADAAVTAFIIHLGATRDMDGIAISDFPIPTADTIIPVD